MSVDLLTTVRLLHKVLGFLVQQSPEHLQDIADGRKALELTDPDRPSAQVDARPMPPVSQQAPAQQTVRQTSAVNSDKEFAEIAGRLRGFASVDEGADYLANLRLGGKKARKADLVKVGAEMGLTLSDRAGLPELHRRLIDHAIGAKKKYAGLAQW